MSNLSVDQVPTLSYRLNGSLTSLDASLDRINAVVVGREVLRVLRVEETEIRDVLNLRYSPGGVLGTFGSVPLGNDNVESRISIANPNHLIKMSNLNMNMNDVKWEPIANSATIATAAANGAIVVWHLLRPTESANQKFERVITEHSRAVNRICFNKQQPSQLMSGSQDGTVKIWDLRVKGIARLTLECKSDGVRDVQFNPVNVNEICACFENGNVQKWDLRKPKMCERRWNAHNGPVLNLDWHENGKYLATGGRDKAIKVWNTVSQVRKPLCNISTMASVSIVTWRPGSETQLANCSLSNDMAIHVRDLQRRFVPLYTWQDHENFPTGLLWKDSDTIWSCGKDRNFIRTNLRGAYRYADALSTCALAWSPTGGLAYSAEEWNPESLMDSMNSLRVPTGNAGSLSTLEPGVDIPDGSIKLLHTETTVQRYSVRQKSGLIISSYLAPLQGGLREFANNLCFESDVNCLRDICLRNATAAYVAKMPQTFALWACLSIQVLRKMHHSLPCRISKSSSIKLSKNSSVAANERLASNGSDYESDEDYERSRGERDVGRSSMLSSLNSMEFSGSLSWKERNSAQNSVLSDADAKVENEDAFRVSDANSSSANLSPFLPFNNKNNEAALSAMREALFLASLLFKNSSGPVTPSLLTEHPLMSLYLQPENHFPSRNAEPFPTKINSSHETGLVHSFSANSFGEYQQAATERHHSKTERSRATSSSSQNNTEQSSKTMSNKVLVEISKIVKHSLDVEGNALNAVALILVFQNYCGGWDAVVQYFGQSMLEQLMLFTVELLRKFQLWTPAAYLIKSCPMPAIQLLLQEGTSVSLLCMHCKKQMPTISEEKSTKESKALYLCGSCKTPVAKCFYCQLPVKGLLVWCVVCGISVHLSCFNSLAEYFGSYPDRCHSCDSICSSDILKTARSRATV